MERQAREDPVKEDKPQANICKYTVSRIYEELSKFNSKKTLIRKWAKDTLQRGCRDGKYAHEKMCKIISY